MPKAVIDERAKEVAVVLPPITDDMDKMISGALRPGAPESQVLCDAYGLTITRRDINSLAGLNWLNDQVLQPTDQRSLWSFMPLLHLSLNSSIILGTLTPQLLLYNNLFCVLGIKISCS